LQGGQREVEEIDRGRSTKLGKEEVSQQKEGQAKQYSEPDTAGMRRPRIAGTGREGGLGQTGEV